MQSMQRILLQDKFVPKLEVQTYLGNLKLVPKLLRLDNGVNASWKTPNIAGKPPKCQRWKAFNYKLEMRFYYFVVVSKR